MKTHITVRFLAQMPHALYVRLVDHAGYRALVTLKKHGVHERLLQGILGKRERKAFQQAYQDILIEALTLWLAQQEETRNETDSPCMAQSKSTSPRNSV